MDFYNDLENTTNWLAGQVSYEISQDVAWASADLLYLYNRGLPAPKKIVTACPNLPARAGLSLLAAFARRA